MVGSTARSNPSISREKPIDSRSEGVRELEQVRVRVRCRASARFSRRDAGPPMSGRSRLGSERLRTYREAADFLGSLVRDPPRTRGEREKLGLSPVESLLDRIGNPHVGLPAIHITGSQGKGSTALYAEALLAAAGFRTGTFLSPHLEVWNERIRIEGAPIGDAAFVDALERVRPAVAAMHRADAHTAPAFFDTLGRRRLFRLRPRRGGRRGRGSRDRGKARPDARVPGGGHLRDRRRSGAHRPARAHDCGHCTREGGDRPPGRSSRGGRCPRCGAGGDRTRGRARGSALRAPRPRHHDSSRRPVSTVRHHAGRAASRRVERPRSAGSGSAWGVIRITRPRTRFPDGSRPRSPSPDGQSRSGCASRGGT